MDEGIPSWIAALEAAERHWTGLRPRHESESFEAWMLRVEQAPSVSFD